MNVTDDMTIDDMKANARRATAFLKSIGHEQRLLVLCQLARQELSVGGLAAALDLRQPAVSQHLARLRAEGIITARRDGTTVYYSVQQTEVLPIIDALYSVFCAND
jgi:DNA-binding transcriptional ArsR family regulator